jgi:hypothetical protein
MYDEDEDDLDLMDQDDNQQGEGQQTPAPAAVDPAALAAQVAEQVTSQMQQFQPAAPQRELSPEEIRKHYQIWDPDDSFVNELNLIADPDATPAQRKKILENIRDGIMQQSFRATQLVAEQIRQELRAEFAPAHEFAQQRKAKAALKEMTTKYPGLEGQDELIGMVTSQLTQAGFKPKSRDEAFEKVAKTAEAILKKIDPTFELKTNGGVMKKPSMARVNMGGQGGKTPQGGNTTERRGGLASIFTT